MADPINIKFPLKRSNKGAFETNDTTVNAIADDLRILLLTNHGERLVHFDYGANLREAIFEQGPDLKQKLKDLIIVAVEKWMPFVNILEIIIKTSSEDTGLLQNEVNIALRFSVGQEKGQLSQTIRG
jgi:phage baseplate assembly protein W